MIPKDWGKFPLVCQVKINVIKCKICASNASQMPLLLSEFKESPLSLVLQVLFSHSTSQVSMAAQSKPLGLRSRTETKLASSQHEIYYSSYISSTSSALRCLPTCVYVFAWPNLIWRRRTDGSARLWSAYGTAVPACQGQREPLQKLGSRRRD